MNRRTFLAASMAAPLPLAAQSAESRAPRNLRITDVQVTVTNPSRSALGNYVLVKILTEGW